MVIKSSEIQRRINEYNYWDARVSKLECRNFTDEIELAHEHEDGEIVYEFFGCYKSEFDHAKDYDKLRPVKDMTRSQIPYFMQDVKIDTQLENGITFYTCKINMFPLYVEIWCKDISITKRDMP